MKMTLYLRSGQTVEVDIESATKATNRATGAITKLEWMNKEEHGGCTELFMLALDELVAVTTRDDPDPIPTLPPDYASRARS